MLLLQARDVLNPPLDERPQEIESFVALIAGPMNDVTR